MDATSANTASKVVARDASGNFSAGTVTANLTGNVTGTASGNLPLSGGTITGQTSISTKLYVGGATVNSGYNGVYASGMVGAASGNKLIYLYNDGSTIKLDAYDYGVGGALSFNIGGNGGTVNVAGTLTQNGSQVLTAGNYNSYAPTLTGGGASGTWGINITGSAGSASTATSATTASSSPLLSALGIYVWSASTLPTGYNQGIQCSFVSSGQGFQSYGSVMTMNTYSGGGGALQIYVPYSPTYGGTGLQVRFGNYDVNTGNSWTSWKTLLASDNYSSYALPLSGGTLTGQLRINGNDNQLVIDGTTSSLAAAMYFAESGTNKWELYHYAGQLRFYNYTSGAQEGAFYNSGGYLELRTSVRAPIFYDSNNTGYYLDPASTSYLYGLTLAGGSYFRPNNWIQLDSTYGLYWPNHYGAHFTVNTSSTYTQLMMVGSKNSYGGLYDSYSAVNGIMYDSSGNGGVYREANGRWYFYYNVSNDCMGIGTSSTSSTYSLYLNKGVYAQNRVDGTIFYDANNTGYYLDPESGSQLSAVYSNNWFRPQGCVGLYFESYGRGIRSADCDFSYGNVGTYGGGLNGWYGYGIYPNNAILMFNGSSGGLYNPQWGWMMNMDMNGNTTFGGNVTAYSDLRLKENVREIDNVVARRDALAKAAIKYEREGRTRIGYGAQTLRDNGNAEFVLEADDNLKLVTGMGTLSVDYGETAAVLAVASKMTDDRIAVLEAELAMLKQMVVEGRHAN